MTICKGCGISLQTSDPQAAGYVGVAGGEYCQRCYRLRHYGQVQVVPTDFNYQTLANALMSQPTLLVWVVDILDLESSLISGINRIFNYQPLLLVITKRDLLPTEITTSKLIAFIKQRLAAAGIVITDLLLFGLNQPIQRLTEFIEAYRNQQDVAFIGQTNAGKSTLINRLTQGNELTVARYPGTTLELLSVDYQSYHLYDSPGFNHPGNYLWYLSPAQIKQAVINAPLKPRIYQVYEPQRFQLADLVRIDFSPQTLGSVVFYFAETLKIQRGKLINPAKVKPEQQAWKKTTFNLLTPPFDIVISGLGWFKVVGAVSSLAIYTHPAVLVTIRRSMI